MVVLCNLRWAAISDWGTGWGQGVNCGIPDRIYQAHYNSTPDPIALSLFI